MRYSPLIIVPLMAVTIGVSASAADAQPSIVGAKSVAAVVLANPEGRPITPQLILMTIDEWNAKAANLDQRMNELNARVQSLLARCQGSYPADQLAALQAQCDAETNQLKAEMAQLLEERANLLAERPS